MTAYYLPPEIPKIVWALERLNAMPCLCSSTDVVGACVRVVDVIDNLQLVSTVDPTQPGMMPAAGILVSKSDTMHCTVSFFGIYTTWGLIPGASYFVNVDGSFATGMLPKSRPFTLQWIGQAMSDKELLIQPGSNVLRMGG